MTSARRVQAQRFCGDRFREQFLGRSLLLRDELLGVRCDEDFLSVTLGSLLRSFGVFHVV
jgi:hypothetical protein